MSGTLWIDMTDLSRWSGHMTGVQRTVYEIASRYHGSKESVAYFVYDDIVKDFYIIDFEAVIKSITEVKQKTITPPSLAKRTIGKLTRSTKSLYQELPDETKEKIPESLRELSKLSIKGAERVARTILHQVRVSKAKQAAKQFRRSAVSPDQQSRLFKKGDTVLVLGASWDSKTKIFDIVRLKNEIGFRYVQLIHDVIPSFHPHLFGDGFAADFNTRIFESIANADRLLCNSETTSHELKRLCNIMRITPPAVSLIRLGDDYTQSERPTRPNCDLKKNEPFILCVGTYEIRKNHTLLYYAVKEALVRKIEIPKIIIIGKPGWLVGDLSYILANDPDVKGHIQYLGGVSDEEKTWLFMNCSFTIFPAMFEGWGLPVGESLYYKKPCLSSSVSSMPEIGGTLVDYFSPFNSGECLDKIVYYSDPQILKQKRLKIEKSYQQHTWDETFRQTHKAISALKKHESAGLARVTPLSNN